jgi:predicted TIM-barrel fold metal-dependent hydrolase
MHRQSSEMFFDLTPGTPEIYRKDLLTKLWRVGYDVQDNMMFGSDSLSDDYNPSWVKTWIERDDAIYDELGVTQEQREKIYRDNFLRMIEGRSIHHILPTINK